MHSFGCQRIYVILQDVHAPILGLWGIKMFVIAVFVAFTLASIVSGSRTLHLINSSEMFIVDDFYFMICYSRIYNRYPLVLILTGTIHQDPTWFGATNCSSSGLLPSGLNSLIYSSSFSGFCFHSYPVYLVSPSLIHLSQGYFTNVSEYLRIGPPLYFVVKDYNYRY